MVGSLERIIKLSKRIEATLEGAFGASGRGLHEKISSVEKSLPENIVKRARRIATIRNKAVHEDGFKIDGMSEIERDSDELINDLTRLAVRINEQRQENEVVLVHKKDSEEVNFDTIAEAKVLDEFFQSEDKSKVFPLTLEMAADSPPSRLEIDQLLSTIKSVYIKNYQKDKNMLWNILWIVPVVSILGVGAGIYWKSWIVFFGVLIGCSYWFIDWVSPNSNLDYNDLELRYGLLLDAENSDIVSLEGICKRFPEAGEYIRRVNEQGRKIIHGEFLLLKEYDSWRRVRALGKSLESPIGDQ